MCPGVANPQGFEPIPLLTNASAKKNPEAQPQTLSLTQDLPAAPEASKPQPHGTSEAAAAGKTIDMEVPSGFRV